MELTLQRTADICRADISGASQLKTAAVEKVEVSVLRNSVSDYKNRQCFRIKVEKYFKNIRVERQT